MVKIQQIESPIPDVGIIYAGLVAHTAILYTKLAKQPITTDTKTNYLKEINFLMEFPDDFLKDKKGREVFSVSEIADYLGCHAIHVSKNCPREYFVANRSCNLDFRQIVRAGGLNIRGIAVKNCYMWNKATPQEVNKYLQKFKKKD